MRSHPGSRLAIVVLLVAAIVPCSKSIAQEPAQAPHQPATKAEPGTGDTTSQPANSPAKPKPLSSNTKKGLEYLIEQQNSNGGWGQGGGWRQGSQGRARVEDKDAKDTPDLANTCIAALALIRAGNTTETGEYAKQLAKAVDFICARVENADADSLYVTDVRDTQLQSKIGPYVDTFLAGLVLSELKGKAPAEGADKRLLAALDKTVKKIEKNQKTDGTFAGNTGWASVLSQGLASKAMNRAAQNSVKLGADVLERDYKQTVASLDKKTGDFDAAAPEVAAAKPVSGAASATSTSGAAPVRAAGRVAAMGGSDAGVKLYNSSSNASRLSDFGNTAATLELRAKSILANESSGEEEKTKAKGDLAKVADIKEAQQAAVNGIIRQLDDKKFIAGFGNNGGEEFLSYMNIGEMLVVSGGPKWESWDKSIAENLNRVQNKDGSWSGDHCITGRTFCTAAALLTLMADRAPVPAAAKPEEKAKAPADSSATSEK
jgi:hypothetical protein